MKKILYLIDSLKIGGSEKHLVDLVTKIDKRKFEPFVCSLHDGPLKRKLIKNKVKFKIINTKEIKYIFSINIYHALYKFLKNKKFDIYHAFSPDLIIYSIFAKKIHKIPLVVTERRSMGYDIECNKDALCAIKVANKYADKIIAVCEAVKQKIIYLEKMNNPDKIEIIYNGLDIKKYDRKYKLNKIKKKFGIKNNEFVVSIVSNMNRKIKGHEWFIKTIPLILKKIKNVKFIFVGSGKLKQDLIKIATKLGIIKNIIFTGIVEDPTEIIKISDVCVLSSLSEGISNSLLEYMACSKVVVATGVGGNPEVIINGKTGFLVKANDKKEISEKIIKLLKNKKLRERMGEKGRKRIEEIFDLEKMINSYEKIYEELNASK